MVIYLDIVIILDFLINFIFIILIEIIFKEKVRNIRKILSSLLGVLLLISFLFNEFWFNFLKGIGGILISVLAFSTRDTRKLFVKTSFFYLLNFSFVGLLKSFNITKWYLLIGTLLIIAFLVYIQDFKKYFILTKTFTYNVSVSFLNYSVKTTGYLDTGNFSFHDNKPVIYLEKKYYQEMKEVGTSFFVETVKGKEILIGYNAKIKIDIGKKKKIEKDVIVVFSNLDKYFPCLLNSLIFI